MRGSILSWLIEKLLERNIDVAQTYTTSPFPFHQCHMSILQLSCHWPPVKHWCPSPEWPVILNTLHPQTQPWFLCDSLTIHQSRKDLHEQRVSGLHHPKGPSSVSHSLLILVQSNWVDWTPVLEWSMRQTESRLKMIGREAYGYGYAVQQKTKKSKDNERNWTV